MGSVVRCPTCQGASQVESEALGLTVRCPRCDATFIAIEELEAVLPTRATRNPTLPVPEPRPERTRRRRERGGERDRERRREHGPTPDQHNHDPHRDSPGSLPASVLIGLALLPFAIPILWLIAPAVVGKEPAISIATPAALAVSASILCLAVIYTVDWTATTRVKGVLMLVGLAYFGALSLYFVKKNMVEKVQRFIGKDDRVQWRVDHTADYEVSLPGHTHAVPEEDLPIRSIRLPCRAAVCDKMVFGQCRFAVGSGKLPDNAADPQPGSDAWFTGIIAEIVTRSGGQQNGEAVPLNHQDAFPGRQLEIRLPDKETIRIVRVFVVRGTVYYLSVEGIGMHPGDEHARIFFDSFDVPRARH